MKSTDFEGNEVEFGDDIGDTIILIDPQSGGLIGAFSCQNELGRHLFESMTLDHIECVRMIGCKNLSLQMVPLDKLDEVRKALNDICGPALHQLQSPARG